MLDSSDGVGRGAKSGWQIAVCVCVSVFSVCGTQAHPLAHKKISKICIP